MNDQPSFKLIIIDDEGKSTVVPLTRQGYTIGRQEGNVIRLTERNVSRQHAKLSRENGKFFIEDLNSYNGVFINNTRIKQKQELKSGDNIRIGDYRLVFKETTGIETEDSIIIKEELVKPPIPRVATALPGEKPKLIFINGPTAGKIVNLEMGETIVGRGDKVNILIDEPSVSREHAKFILEKSYCKIVDLDSSNGVRINGVQVKEHYLAHGDTIELGNILIRFVAAGAWDLLLEQIQQQEALVGVKAIKKPLFYALPLVVFGLIVIVGVVYLLSVGGRKKNPETATKELSAINKSKSEKIMNVDDLIRNAQKAYDEFKWREAIKYAAKALEFEPSNERALKIKERSTRELENQPIFDEGVSAMKAGQWERAYTTLKKLSLDSAYRTKEEFYTAINNFINAEIKQLRKAAEENQWKIVEEKSLLIESLPEATPSQKAEAQMYAKLAEKARRKEAGGTSTAGLTSTLKTTKGKKGSAKYSGGSTDLAAESSPDPIVEARKAILAGDQLKCIKILERAKTSQIVLKMLASCYKAAGNIERYYHILERFIAKYPTSPDAEKFKAILKAAGRL